MKNNFKKLINIVSLPVLSLSCVPFVMTSCSKQQDIYNIALISDSSDDFEFADDPILFRGKTFTTTIVNTFPENNIEIENINIWSSKKGFLLPAGIIEEKGDFQVAIADDRGSAQLTVFDPEDDLFVILSSSNSKTITPINDNQIVFYPDSGKNLSREIILKYYDYELPDSNLVSCYVWKTNSDKITPENFILDEPEFSTGDQKIYIPLNITNIPPLTEDINCEITLRFSYSMEGINFERFVSVNIQLKKGNYEPIKYIGSSPMIARRDTSSSDEIYKATGSFKFDETVFGHLPFKGFVYCDSIIYKQEEKDGIITVLPNDLRAEIETDEETGENTFSVTFTIAEWKQDVSILKFNLILSYFVDAKTIEYYTVEQELSVKKE